MKRTIRVYNSYINYMLFLFVVACTSYSVDSEYDYYSSSSIEETNLTFKLIKIA